MDTIVGIEEMKDICILGKNVSIDGKPDNGYFNSAQHIVDAEKQIGNLASGLPHGAIVFDIGANIGLMSLLIAVARPDLRIFAFEASPEIIGYLRANTAPFANIDVVHVALSNRASTLRFSASEEAAVAHVVGSGHLDPAARTIDVAAIPLDDFVKERNLSPSFIKIDVEGHEPEVLSGAAHTISSANPTILMEFNSWTLAMAGHNPAAFAQSIWAHFEVEGFDRAIDFLHDNFINRGCITDIVLRLKQDATVPSLADMSVSQFARRLLAEESA